MARRDGLQPFEISTKQCRGVERTEKEERNKTPGQSLYLKGQIYSIIKIQFRVLTLCRKENAWLCPLMLTEVKVE